MRNTKRRNNKRLHHKSENTRKNVKRTRKAGMFRAAVSQARHITKELSKELAKDIVDKSVKKAIKEEKKDVVSRLSSGRHRRAKSRLSNAHIVPTNLSQKFAMSAIGESQFDISSLSYK